MTDINTAVMDKLGSVNIFNGTGKANQKMLQWAQGELTRCRQARMQFERQWFMNLAFYFGKQYYQWTSQLGPIARLIEPKAPPWRVRAVSNKIKPIARSEHAKLNKESPLPFVIPSTTDDADVYAARAAEQILDHLTREMHFAVIRRRATFWTILAGNGFIKDWWDPRKKDESGNQGVIDWEHVTPFHLYVPSMLEEEIESQPYIIHSVSKSPFYVQKYFKKTLEPKQANDPVDNIMSRVYQALGLQEDASQTIQVNEMYIKESEHFPEGGKMVWAQDEILHVEHQNTRPYADYPFSHIAHVPTGRFYADSVIPDLVPLQKEYNRTKSQIIEAKNLMAKPQLTAQQGAIDVKKLTSEPGLVITYRPGFQPPEPLPMQNLPSYVMESLDLIQRDMDDISSQHEVTKGRTPPGVTAATAIAYLQEEDDSKLSSTISSLEEAVEKVGTHLLKWVRKNWTQARTVKILGDEQMHEAYQFKGADLRDNTSVTVESGSASPRSKAAKQAFIMELGKLGWIPPDKALRYLDMAESGALYRDMHIDQRQSQRENIIMYQNWKEIIPSMVDEATGEPMGTLPVNTWDNHQVHILEHNNFRKRQAFEMLPEEAQEVFERHVNMHVQLTGQQFGNNLESGDVLPADLDPGIPEIPPGSMGAEEGMLPPEQMGGEQMPPEQLTQMPPSGGPQTEEVPPEEM